MMIFIWLLVVIFFHMKGVENDQHFQIKYSNINVDINKPIGYSIHRFRCYFTSCNYEFDPKDLSSTIWQIVDDEVIVIQNLHHIYKNYGRNHLIPVLHTSRKNSIKSVVEVLNVTLSKPTDSCSPFFLPKLISSGWIMAKSPVGSVVLGLDHLIFKSGNECTPQIRFTDKIMSNNYNFTIVKTTDPKLHRVYIYTRKYLHNKDCKEQYSCREYVTLILSHKPTGTYQLLNVTINVLASGRFMPHITSHYVNHMKIPLETPVGELVGQVNVNDFDPGFDGELVYTMNLSPYFYIDVFNGKVYSLQTITTPIEGYLEVTIRDRSCYIHSQPIHVNLYYSTVSKITIYKPPGQKEHTINAQKALYKVVNLYSDLPNDSYVVSGADFAKAIHYNHSLSVKISFSDQQTKQLLYMKDNAVYYRGINEKNSKYFSPSAVHNVVAVINADNSVYTAHIYVTLQAGRTCLGALPKIKFNKPFQLVDTGNLDTRIAFDSSTEFLYDSPAYLVDYRKKITSHDSCFSKKYLNISVVDSYQSDNFYMSDNSNYISSRYPLYDPDNDYYILIEAVNEVCNSEIPYKGFAVVKLNVQLKHNKYNPFFHKPTYVFNISESLKPPSYVGSVKIRFADSIGYLLNSNYYYYIKNYNTITSSYIALERNSGVITLLKNVDRELVPQLKFGISAFNPQNNHSVETVVVINIDDEDDNPPVFPRKHVEINLEQDSGYIDQVLCVHADDKDDTRKFPLSYYIHKGPKHLFHLDPTTGVLSLVGSLKSYDSNETIKLYIRAKDTKHYDEMILDIFVEKSFDETPLFHKFVHNIVLIKDASAGTIVAVFDVVLPGERLYHISCRFGRDISFTFASLFSLRFDRESKACYLYLLRSLTYTDVKNILAKQNSFLIELYDNKRNVMFPAQSLVNVKLLLTDNKVVFEQNDYLFQHFDMIKSGDAVGRVKAFNFYQDTDQIFYKLESFSDCDSSRNCSIDHLHTLFNVERETGLVSCIKSMLAVGFEEEVLISATNSAGLQSVVSIKVIVLPLSYKPLFGSIKPIEISLSESSPVGTGYTIASFKPSNHGHINAMVDIVGGNWLNHFKIVQNETITLIHKIDFESVQSYNIRYRWKQIVDNNTFDSVYLENVVHIKVIDENDNVPIFPDEDPAFLIIQGLGYSRQYFAHFQAYDGDIEYKFRKIRYKFTNSRVSIFIHPTLGIISVTNDFTLFDQVMVLTIKAENEDNPSLYALKNFSIIIVRSQLEDSSLESHLSDQYKSEIANMNIEFNLDAQPIQYVPRKIYNQKPQHTIGRLFQNPLYGQRNFMCADPYGFNNIYPIDAARNSPGHLINPQRFTSADSIYVYKVSGSVYRIQNIVVELKSSKRPSLECTNFNDDLYFVSNNNITKIKPKLSCVNDDQLNLQYSLVSSSRTDFNDVLTLGTHSGVVYIHKLPDLLFPITEYFTYQILDPATNNYVFGRISIQIVNINYDIKISDLPVINVYVDSPVNENQFIYNPRLSDGRTSVGYKFYWTPEPLDNSDLSSMWLNINSTNGHITAAINYTLVDVVKLALRATLLSPNGDNVTSATQIIQLNPNTLQTNPNVDVDTQLVYSYTVLIGDKTHTDVTPYGLYVGRIPALSKGIHNYHCHVLSTNLLGLSDQTICDNALLLNLELYLSPTIYTSIEHFKRFLNLEITVCQKKCVPLTLNLLIIKPASSAPYFVNCSGNHTIFVENNQPISLPLLDRFDVSEIFEDVYICSVYGENPYFSAHPNGGTHCVVAPRRYLMLNNVTNFIEKLNVDFKPHYLRHYADRVLLRKACSSVDLIVHNYFPYYDSDIDNYGVANVDDGLYQTTPIICIQKRSYGSVFSIVLPTQQQYVTVDVNDGCVYMLKAFSYSVIQRLSLIVKEVLFKSGDSPRSKICQNSCVIHHKLNIIVDKMNYAPEIIVQTQHLNIPINAPLNYKILDLSENPRDAYFFISCDNSTKFDTSINSLPPIDIDPEAKSLVIVGNISNYVNNATNIQKTIMLNMAHESIFDKYSSSKKLHLSFSYQPISTSKSSFTLVVPINQFPGIIGKIELETFDSKQLSYLLKVNKNFKPFGEVFSVNSAGEIYLLKRLDPSWFEYNYPSMIDLELLVTDNSISSRPTIIIPVSVIITHLWGDYSLTYAERDVTITYDELAQFATGSQLKKFTVNNAASLPLNVSSNIHDSILYTSELIPLMMHSEYRPLVQLSPNGALYKTVDNELLRGEKLNDQIYAVDLRNPKGDIVDSTILQLVEVSVVSLLKCAKFNFSPIFVTIHPSFKVNKLLTTVHILNGCNKQNIKLDGYFNELADCMTFGVGKQSNNLYLICDIQTLFKLLDGRTTSAYFIAAVEKNGRKKAYNRLVFDFRRLYSPKHSKNSIQHNILAHVDGISYQPYFFNKLEEIITIPHNLPKDHTITYVEPLDVRNKSGLCFMLECSINPCPFSINSTTGAVHSKQDLASIDRKHYNLSIILVDQLRHYVVETYKLVAELTSGYSNKCNKELLSSMSIQISSSFNLPGTAIARLPATHDGCYVVADLMVESSNYFYLNPLTRVVHISKKLPYGENKFNFAYFLSPTLYFNKRDPSLRSLLTVELLKDDFNQIRFLHDKREFTIEKTHPSVPLSVFASKVFELIEHDPIKSNSIIGLIPLDRSKVRTYAGHKLAVRIMGVDEANYFHAHLHPNLTNVAIFLHRQLPIPHYVNRWTLSLEIYRMDDMIVVDRTLPESVTINVLNVPTTSPLLNSSIGQIIVHDAFPQTAEKVQFFSPDLLDCKYIVIRVDPKLKSFIRIVRSVDRPGEAEVVIQSLWKAALNKKLISFNVIIGYMQLNDSTSEQLLFPQQYTLGMIVLKQNSSTNQLNTEPLNPRYLNARKQSSSASEQFNFFIFIPSLSGGSPKELPVFLDRGELSLLSSNYHYNNFTLIGEDLKLNNRFHSYFVNKIEKSLFAVSTITPPGVYKVSVWRTHKLSKTKERIVFNVNVFKRNEKFYRRENHIVVVLRSNEFGLLYTSSNIFFKPQDFITVTQSKCFSANSHVKVFILSLGHQLYYSRQLVYMHIGAVDQRSNISIKAAVLRDHLENCQSHIEQRLSANVVSFDDNECVAHSCQLGNCVTETTINFDNSIVTYFLSEHRNSNNYYIFPKLDRDSVCSSDGIANGGEWSPNVCLNGGFEATHRLQLLGNKYNNFDNLMCLCPGGFRGKHCESTEVSFSNKSQQPLIYNPITFNVNTEISFSFVTSLADGVLLLQNSSHSDILQHFHFAVKLMDGSLVVELLFYNNQDNRLQTTYENIFTNMTSLVVGSTLNDGRIHHVKIIKRNKNISVKLDNCESNVHVEKPYQKTHFNYSFCGVSDMLLSEHNVHNGSLKLLLGSKFSGCISNMAINGVAMDFNSFLRPQPPHTSLNVCLFGIKSCPRCKNGYCNRSSKLAYTCQCYDGWTGETCNVRMNSYSVKQSGYIMVDQSFLSNISTLREVESSHYSFYVEFSPVFSFMAADGQPKSYDHIFVYESNDEFTEYSIVRARNGFIEFANNLGDKECLVQFPVDFRNYLSSLAHDFQNKNINITLKNNVYKQEHLKDQSNFLPLKNGFIKIVAKRYRNVISIKIPYLGEVSRHCGINNLLSTNRRIFIGNAPSNSPHHLKHNRSSTFSSNLFFIQNIIIGCLILACYASISLNRITVSDITTNITKFNATVDCSCKQNKLICVGKSMCVGSHDDYCGCLGNPGTYCGHLQLTFNGRNLMYIVVLFAIFAGLWIWLCLLIYKHFSFRYFRFKHKNPPKRSSQITLLDTIGGFDKHQENNLSGSYPPSLQQFNDINVKNIVKGLIGNTDEIIHFSNQDIHDNYKPTFKIFVKQSDDEETNDQFKTLPPLANDATPRLSPYKNILPSMNERHNHHDT